MLSASERKSRGPAVAKADLDVAMFTGSTISCAWGTAGELRLLGLASQALRATDPGTPPKMLLPRAR